MSRRSIELGIWGALTLIAAFFSTPGAPLLLIPSTVYVGYELFLGAWRTPGGKWFVILVGIGFVGPLILVFGDAVRRLAYWLSRDDAPISFAFLGDVSSRAQFAAQQEKKRKEREWNKCVEKRDKRIFREADAANRQGERASKRREKEFHAREKIRARRMRGIEAQKDMVMAELETLREVAYPTHYHVMELAEETVVGREYWKRLPWQMRWAICYDDRDPNEEHAHWVYGVSVELNFDAKNKPLGFKCWTPKEELVTALSREALVEALTRLHAQPGRN